MLKNQRETWKHRLQHVHLRTKIMVPLLVLAVIPAGVLGTFTIFVMREALWESVVKRVEFDTVSKAEVIDRFLLDVQQDLKFLSQMSTVKELVQAETVGDTQSIETLRHKLEREFLIFSQGKRAFYQVRYLNGAGQEVVRLNVRDGLPIVVSIGALQDKAHRYYVKEALALEPGETFVSSVDFNVEHGSTEEPPRKVVRYATKVTGNHELGQGLLIINLYADYLLSLVGPLDSGTKAWLLDISGSKAEYVGDAQDSGVPETEGVLLNFGLEHIQTFLGETQGGLMSETEETLLFSAPISVGSSGSERRWVLLVSRSRSPIETPIRRLTVLLTVILLLTVTVAITLGVFIGNYFVRPIMRLRNATREIAGGNLSAQVNIMTGDEIEELASDFNVMAKKLGTAQELLSSWNVELEREVERQIEKVHQLQVGLAKTDKLAAIGQMTASVMHEVGNPLAAIKTKVQVAQEEGSTQKDYEELLPEILKEVDRLAVFLHSFSHLGTLQKPSFEVVSPLEVIQEVVTLVAPDLRRRKLSLHQHTAANTPSIKGDGNRLRQLLINLILNAADASTQESEIVVKIGTIGSTQEGEREGVMIEVIDQGEGMSEEILGKIFEPFFTTKAEGTGLGLAICRQVVEDHHGTIEVVSEPGVGTTVRMLFPALIRQLEDEESLERSPRETVL